MEMYCRVCGFMSGISKWVNGIPNYFIGDCCGAENGIDDEDLSMVRRYRQDWIAKGAVWFDAKEEPSNWNLVVQMENIPDE